MCSIFLCINRRLKGSVWRLMEHQRIFQLFLLRTVDSPLRTMFKTLMRLQNSLVNQYCASRTVVDCSTESELSAVLKYIYSAQFCNSREKMDHICFCHSCHFVPGTWKWFTDSSACPWRARSRRTADRGSHTGGSGWGEVHQVSGIEIRITGVRQTILTVYHWLLCFWFFSVLKGFLVKM